MLRRFKWFGIAIVLAVLGVVSWVIQPGPPASVCAPKGAATSGFQDASKHCAISVDSWRKIADYNSSPKLFRIAAILLVLAAIVVAIIALVKWVRGRTRPAQAAA